LREKGRVWKEGSCIAEWINSSCEAK
jgi:hypothetical protein